MNDLVLKSVMAGLMFGIWPLLMQRSGLSGNVSSAIFAGVAFLIVVPFAIHSGVIGAIKLAPLPMLGLVAGIFGGIGLLFLNGMLAKVSVEQVGIMFVIMILVQLMVPVLYQFAITGDYSVQKIVGVIAAFVAVILLV